MSLLQRSQASDHLGVFAVTTSGSSHTGFISDLLLRCGRGDAEAFAVLLDTFYPLAFAITATVVPQDIDGSVQAAFITIWEDSPLYRPGAETSVSWIMRHVIAASHSQRAAPSPGSSEHR